MDGSLRSVAFDPKVIKMQAGTATAKKILRAFSEYLPSSLLSQIPKIKIRNWVEIAW